MITIQILAAMLIFVGGAALAQSANGPSLWAVARGLIGFLICVAGAPLFLIWCVS